MEEEKRVEVQRAIVEFKHGDYRTQTLLFTAGTTLLMAWLKRAVMMCLVEQWRAWVFLALNLVLLAIVFTSTRSVAAAASEDEETNRSSDDNKTNSNAEVAEMERKKRREQCRRSGGVAELVVGNELIIRGCDHKTGSRRRRRSSCSSSSNTNSGVEIERVDHDEAADTGESRALSKEELNERVEAFITMFRQHLVLDARRGRS